MAEARTIELLLTNGSLNGLLRAELAKWNGVMFSSPRDSFQQLSNQQETKYWGIYLLLSDDKVYVGQANELLRRIGEHDRGKDWWTRVVLLTTTNDSLTRSDIDWLENKLIDIAHNRGTLDVENRVKGNKPKVSVFREANLDDYLEGGLLLLELIGIRVFSNKAKKTFIMSNINNTLLPITTHSILSNRISKRDINKLVGKTLYYKTNAGNGFHSIVYVNSIKEYVLKANSTIHIEDYTQMWPTKAQIFAKREEYKKLGALIGLKVVKDITFGSLNQVATFIRGQNVNAWISFVDSNGVAIEDIVK